MRYVVDLTEEESAYAETIGALQGGGPELYIAWCVQFHQEYARAAQGAFRVI